MDTSAAEYNLYVMPSFRAVESLLRATLRHEMDSARSSAEVAIWHVACARFPSISPSSRTGSNEMLRNAGLKPSSRIRTRPLSVYSDLETLGAVEGGGWKHLRSVVRAHCLHILTKLHLRACSTSILPIFYSHSAAPIGSPQERWSGLVESIVTLPPRRPSPRFGFGHVDPWSMCATMLFLLAADLGSAAIRSMIYRSAAQLLRNGSFPVDRILTPTFNDTWAELLATITSGPDCGSAADFIIAVISSLGSRTSSDFCGDGCGDKHIGTSDMGR